jgi:pilus assembly protein CpaB
MKKILHSRIAVGTLCIILAVGITFGLSPFITETITAREEVLFAVKEIQQGDLITEKNTEMRKIGIYNIPGTVITKAEMAIGKYASYDILPGDYITSEKFQSEESADFRSFSNLDGTKVAMSVPIQEFSYGVSGKLSKGDIITFLAVDTQSHEARIIPELQYVYVMAVTLSEGSDKDDTGVLPEGDTSSTSNVPSTITVLVSGEQATLLGGADEAGHLWALLAYRGGEKTAREFLGKQDAYNEAAASGEDEQAAGAQEEGAGEED